MIKQIKSEYVCTDFTIQITTSKANSGPILALHLPALFKTPAEKLNVYNICRDYITMWKTDHVSMKPIVVFPYDSCSV